MTTQTEVTAMVPLVVKVACAVAAIWLFFFEKNYVAAAIFALGVK